MSPTRPAPVGSRRGDSRPPTTRHEKRQSFARVELFSSIGATGQRPAPSQGAQAHAGNGGGDHGQAVVGRRYCRASRGSRTEARQAWAVQEAHCGLGPPSDHLTQPIACIAQSAIDIRPAHRDFMHLATVGAIHFQCRFPGRAQTLHIGFNAGRCVLWLIANPGGQRQQPNDLLPGGGHPHMKRRVRSLPGRL
jgi:hypothetical protein